MAPLLVIQVLSLVFGIGVPNTEIHCTRVLTAKNIKQVAPEVSLAALLKLMPVFLFLVPGVWALGLKCKETAGQTQHEAFPV